MNKQILNLNSMLLGAVALVGMSTNVRAVDGVVLINQDRALGGNVTPGDAPGFPVTISRSGSYRLAGNLTVPNGTNGIESTATSGFSDLDLNGFTIKGQTTCLHGSPSSSVPNSVSCSPTGTDVGIKNISVRNGTVTGFGSHGVFLEGSLGKIENVRAFSNGGVGIACNNYCIVSHVTAFINFRHGIEIGSGIVESSTASENGFDGISVSSDAIVFHSQANSNGYNLSGLTGGGGITLNEGSVIGCTTLNNNGRGIAARSNTVLTNNNSSFNRLGGISASDGQISGNTVTRNDGPGISVVTGGIVTGNSVREHAEGLSLGQYVGYSNNVLFFNNLDVIGGVSLGENLCSGALCP